jgi:ribosomal protein S12 methylthiotransferase
VAPKKKTVGFLSLGCPKNLVDSELMMGALTRSGYLLTSSAQEADVVVVNTCGFIEQAKEESIQAILDMAKEKEDGHIQKLIVTGCLSQRYHEELAKELPEVDAFLGTGHVDLLPQTIADLLDQRPVAVPQTWQPDYLQRQHSPRVLSTGTVSAYVKIAEGCDHTCSFCIIPHLRGTYRSRPIDEIAAEVALLVQQGVVEVNLVAQDSSYYGRDLSLKDGLAHLLERLRCIPGIAWIRLHYLYPYQVSDRLLSLLAEGGPLVPYLDIPLQHADKTMLASMRRGSGRPQLDRFLDRIRQQAPQLFMRSSFIVGYPGETREQFETLCSFVQEQRFHYLGVFTYSHEEGTHAFQHPDDISQEEKAERKDTLMAIQQEISRQRLATLKGTVLPVLIEGIHPETDLLLKGRHHGQAPEVDGEVLITEGTHAVGEIISLTVEETFDYDLAGRQLGGFEV